MKSLYAAGSFHLFGALAAVGRDVAIGKRLIDRHLIQRANGGLAAHLAAGAVVDAVTTFFRAGIRDHDVRAGLRIDRIAMVGERRIVGVGADVGIAAGVVGQRRRRPRLSAYSTWI